MSKGRYSRSSKSNWRFWKWKWPWKWNWIPVLAFINVIAISITLWALFFRKPQPPLIPDYAPQETEEHAETIPNDTGDKLETPQGGGSVSLTYAKEVIIDLQDESAVLLFANPGKSNQDIVIQILVRDTLVAQSGTLTPGHQVNQLDLEKGISGRLVEGVYEGMFRVLYYDRQTGEKAIVNTEIPVTITVYE